MGIGKDGRRSTVLTKHIQDLVRIATFLRACIEFAVRIGTSPTLTETIVTLRIHLLRLGDVRQVLLTIMHVLAPFQHDGSQAEFYQPEGSKQSARTGSNHNHLWPSFHVRILRPHILIVVRLLVHIHPYLQIHEYLPLARIDAALQDAHPTDRPHVKTIFIGQPVLQPVLLCRYLRHHPYLIFVRHNAAKIRLIFQIIDISLRKMLILVRHILLSGFHKVILIDDRR